MTNYELMLQLFALLLGLSMAELLAGVARSWRIRMGAVSTGETRIRIGSLVPLLGLLVILDQTRFWVTAYVLRDYVTVNYLSLIVMVVGVGGYYVVSTFVFPDDPTDWPDFDVYFLHTKRVVVGGVLFVNASSIVQALPLMATGVRWKDLPFTSNGVSLTLAALYLPGLAALWFVKSKRPNLLLLAFVNALLLGLAIASSQS